MRITKKYVGQSGFKITMTNFGRIAWKTEKWLKLRNQKEIWYGTLIRVPLDEEVSTSIYVALDPNGSLIENEITHEIKHD